MASFEEPTLGEIYRLQNQHYVTTQERFASLESSLKANSDATLQTLQQATKTNGRVNKIEDDFYGKDGYPGTRKEVHELRESFLFTKGAVWLGVALITVVPGAIVAFASMWIKNQVNEANEEMVIRMERIDQKIDDKIEVFQEALNEYDISVEQ